jgi:hypothetical protein
VRRALEMWLAVLALMFLAAGRAHGQSAVPVTPVRTAPNAVYLELGGNGVIYSVNYERILPGDIGLRAGFGRLSLGASSGTSTAKVSATGVPLTVSYLGIGGSSKLELGGGILMEKFTGQASWGPGEKVKSGAFVPMATFILGYRYAPMHGGFNFKLAYTPVYQKDLGFFNWGGISFGYGF